MKELNSYECEKVCGGVDKDAAVLGGTLVGGYLGQKSRVPYGGQLGSAVGGYIGAKLADGANNTVTIPAGSRPNYSNGVFSYNGYQNSRGSAGVPLWMLKGLSSADDPMLK